MGTQAMMYFAAYQDKVKKYCLENGLNFDKLLDCSFGKGKNNFSFAYADRYTDDSKGLLNDTPMPCVLWVDVKSDGSLNFTQTEHTNRFLRA
jgi:hypothetical protein